MATLEEQYPGLTDYIAKLRVEFAMELGDDFDEERFQQVTGQMLNRHIHETLKSGRLSAQQLNEKLALPPAQESGYDPGYLESTAENIGSAYKTAESMIPGILNPKKSLGYSVSDLMSGRNVMEKPQEFMREQARKVTVPIAENVGNLPAVVGSKDPKTLQRSRALMASGAQTAMNSLGIEAGGLEHLSPEMQGGLTEMHEMLTPQIGEVGSAAVLSTPNILIGAGLPAMIPGMNINTSRNRGRANSPIMREADDILRSAPDPNSIPEFGMALDKSGRQLALPEYPSQRVSTRPLPDMPSDPFPADAPRPQWNPGQARKPIYKQQPTGVMDLFKPEVIGDTPIPRTNVAGIIAEVATGKTPKARMKIAAKYQSDINMMSDTQKSTLGNIIENGMEITPPIPANTRTGVVPRISQDTPAGKVLSYELENIHGVPDDAPVTQATEQDAFGVMDIFAKRTSDIPRNQQLAIRPGENPTGQARIDVPNFRRVSSGQVEAPTQYNAAGNYKRSPGESVVARMEESLQRVPKSVGAGAKPVESRYTTDNSFSNVPAEQALSTQRKSAALVPAENKLKSSDRADKRYLEETRDNRPTILFSPSRSSEWFKKTGYSRDSINTIRDRLDLQLNRADEGSTAYLGEAEALSKKRGNITSGPESGVWAMREGDEIVVFAGHPRDFLGRLKGQPVISTYKNSGELAKAVHDGQLQRELDHYVRTVGPQRTSSEFSLNDRYKDRSMNEMISGRSEKSVGDLAEDKWLDKFTTKYESIGTFPEARKIAKTILDQLRGNKEERLIRAKLKGSRRLAEADAAELYLNSNASADIRAELARNKYESEVKYALMDAKESLRKAFPKLSESDIQTLSNDYVQALPSWNDLGRFIKEGANVWPQVADKAISQAVGATKKALTVYNPGIHLPNVIGDITFGVDAGLNWGWTLRNISRINDIILNTKNPLHREFVSRSIIGTEMARKPIPLEVKRAIESQTNPYRALAMIHDVEARLGHTWGTGKLLNYPDQFLKVSLALQASEFGIRDGIRLNREVYKLADGSPDWDRITNYVHDFTPAYDVMHPGLNKSPTATALAIHPFIRFPVENIRIKKNVVTKRPVYAALSRTMAGLIVAGMWGLAAGGLHLAGYEAAGPLEIKDALAREYQNPYNRGKILIPKPTKKDGKVQFWDMTYLFPTGGLTKNIAQHGVLGGTKKEFMSGGLANRQRFETAETRTNTPTEAIAKEIPATRAAMDLYKGKRGVQEIMGLKTHDNPGIAPPNVIGINKQRRDISQIEQDMRDIMSPIKFPKMQREERSRRFKQLQQEHTEAIKQ